MSYLMKRSPNTCSQGRVLGDIGCTGNSRESRNKSGQIYEELRRSPNDHEASDFSKYEVICCLLHSHFGTNAILRAGGSSIEGTKGIFGIRYSRPLPDCTPRTYTLSWAPYGKFTFTTFADTEFKDGTKYVRCYVSNYIKVAWPASFRDAILADARAFSYRFEANMPLWGHDPSQVNPSIRLDSSRLRYAAKEVVFSKYGLKNLTPVQMLGALFALDRENKYEKCVIGEDVFDSYAIDDKFSFRIPPKAPPKPPQPRDW